MPFDISPDWLAHARATLAQYEVQPPPPTEEDSVPRYAPDQYCFVISATGNTIRPYKMTPPQHNLGHYTPEEHDTLERAYANAMRYAERWRREFPSHEWRTWPRRNSSAYQELVTGTVSGNNSGLHGFLSLVDELELAVASNETTRFARAVNYIWWKKYSYAGSKQRAAHKDVVECLELLTGVRYIELHDIFAPPEHVLWRHANSRRDSALVPVSLTISTSFACDACSEWFSRSARRNTDTGCALCEDCARERRLMRCDNCGNYHSATTTCRCGGARRDFGKILNYSANVLDICGSMLITEADKPTIGKEYLMYGVELEVLPRRGISQHAAAAVCGTALQNFAILKHDSSLRDGGFEIVTIPATLLAHRSELWNDFFAKKLPTKTAGELVRSWHTKCCGIHVHLTRDALTPMQLAKLLVFYHEPANEGFLSRIAGRKVGKDARYCHMQKKRMGKNTVRNSLDHHGAIAVSERNNGKTAEVRIFRGNATKHGVLRCIEFVDATVKWCANNASTDVLDYKKFLAWFKQPEIKSQYPELRKHLISLRYLKARVATDKSVQIKDKTGVTKTVAVKDLICDTVPDNLLVA